MATDYTGDIKAGNLIREILDPALNDEKKQEIQLDILNQIFGNTALALPGYLQKNLSSIFNELACFRPEEKNQAVINYLTVGMYSPIMDLNIPIVVDFTAFSADEIRNLPGYIALHEAARAANVAIELSGLLKEEQEGGKPPRITVDASKTYEQGALENAMFYPNLPDPPEPVVMAPIADLKAAKAFTL